MNFEPIRADNLAAAFLAGTWSLAGLVRRGAEAFGAKGKWLLPLARRVLERFGSDPTNISQEGLTAFIGASREFRQQRLNPQPQNQSPRRIFWVKSTMMPAGGPPSTWSVPPLTTLAQLAEWLPRSPDKLFWYCGQYLHRSPIPETAYPRYRYQWIRKRSNRWRLLEKPIFALKQIQRRLLQELLQRIPVHQAVHSYCAGRSLIGFVRPHSHQRIVLRLDLKEFFPSIRASRIHALFTTLGYPSAVARVLTGLCTNAVPDSVLADPLVQQLPAAEARQLRQRYQCPHLPQGAPTSPMLSNLCAFRLDVRLTALARSVGANYTRYADDLAFSGGRDLERAYRRFHVAVCRVALEEGFEIHTAKTRLMRQGVRQQLAGLTVNVHPNIARREYDRLKAILHNCRQHGLRSQNRDGVADFRAVLLGRVQWAHTVCPEKGQKLLQMFEQIDWVGEKS